MFGIRKKIKINRFIKEWKEKNRHNFTVPATEEVFDITRVHIGNGTYGCINAKTFGTEKELYIGNYCSIAKNVVFLLSLEHPLNLLSTYPFKVQYLNKESETFSKGNIIIDDDVWIGYGATILSGVHIGQGAVIAAGAVVCNDVEPYSIVGGVPAKHIKFRFSDSTIKYLMTCDYGQLDKDLIHKHIDELYLPLNCDDLNDVSSIFNWFPKKRSE